jgi:RimJ/RimL family protein N-acetyltransferase
MEEYLRAERLILRRFTDDDVDLLVELDSDPQVKHFVTGGVTTGRQEIVDDVLPAFLAYYDRFAGFGFWAAIDFEQLAISWAGST